MKHLALLLCLLTWLPAAPASEPGTLPVVADPFPAPDFDLRGEDGERYRLSDYRGKLVILNFWATWCPPCRYEMPSLERLWQQVRDRDIVVLAVNVGEDADTIFEFTGHYPMSFPLPMDREGKVIGAYPVRGLPTTYIISPDGRVIRRAVGSREWDDPGLMQELLDLRQPGPS